METSAHDSPAPSAVYEIAGQRFEIGSRGFAEAIAEAHAAHQRPRCMCLRSGDGQGVEMYVARLGDGYIVKRMPDTGSHHAPDCPSYEPPPDFSGLGQVLGSAITEDPATGETTLKLDFPLTKMPGRSQMPPAGGDSDSVASDGTRLSLRGLLHYLWDQAGFNRWSPAMEGKRSWPVIRKFLLQAAESKTTKTIRLLESLYVPEAFVIERRDEIAERRMALLRKTIPEHGSGPRQLVVAIAEVKEILPARYGHKLVFKHVPDLPFMLTADLHARMLKRFEPELQMWQSYEDTHLIAVCTFGVGTTGIASVEELALMDVTAGWIPYDSAFEKTLIDELALQRRRFVKGLRYQLSPTRPLASVVLSDTEPDPTAMYILPLTASAEYRAAQSELIANSKLPSWTWTAGERLMPAPPPRRARMT